MAEFEEPVVVVETPHGNAIDCWVIDEESRTTNTHRSVIIDQEGEVLGDHRLGDDE